MISHRTGLALRPASSKDCAAPLRPGCGALRSTTCFRFRIADAAPRWSSTNTGRSRVWSLNDLLAAVVSRTTASLAESDGHPIVQRDDAAAGWSTASVRRPARTAHFLKLRETPATSAPPRAW